MNERFRITDPDAQRQIQECWLSLAMLEWAQDTDDPDVLERVNEALKPQEGVYPSPAHALEIVFSTSDDHLADLDWIMRRCNQLDEWNQERWYRQHRRAAKLRNVGNVILSGVLRTGQFFGGPRGYK